jgi:hypothetical protein
MKNKSAESLNADPEDLEHIILIIEKSYNIRFGHKELANIRTFGELSDHIISKLALKDLNDCTNQQGFYRLKEVIINLKIIDNKSIQVNTELPSVFPRKSRQKDFKAIKSLLGFQLKALRPKHSIGYSFFIFFFVSIIFLFIDWKFGMIGFFFSILFIRFAEKTGIEFKDKTFGELIKEWCREIIFNQDGTIRP